MHKRFFILFVILLALMANACGSGEKSINVEEYEDGTPKQVAHYDDSGDEPVLTKMEYFYPDGSTKGIELYKDGKREGKWQHWYENGNLWTEDTYVNDKRNGHSVVYYKSGPKSYEGQYKDGLKEGLWQFYDEKGRKLMEIEYHQGKEVKKTKKERNSTPDEH